MVILQVLRLEFEKFRILGILNFYPCLCQVGAFVVVVVVVGGGGGGGGGGDGHLFSLKTILVNNN